MARIRIGLPSSFIFSTIIPVRITDLNYGNHVGNDSILSLIHEARMQFLKLFNYTELDFAGTSLIMADAGIEFRNELFYGDRVKAYVTAGEFTRAGFDLFYKLTKGNDPEVIVAIAKTAMVCYNYEKKKITPVPDEALKVLSPASLEQD
jgi:acyl-CoA thioesterase FadM